MGLLSNAKGLAKTFWAVTRSLTRTIMSNISTREKINGTKRNQIIIIAMRTAHSPRARRADTEDTTMPPMYFHGAVNYRKYQLQKPFIWMNTYKYDSKDIFFLCENFPIWRTPLHNQVFLDVQLNINSPSHVSKTTWSMVMDVGIAQKKYVSSSQGHPKDKAICVRSLNF